MDRWGLADCLSDVMSINAEYTRGDQKVGGN